MEVLNPLIEKISRDLEKLTCLPPRLLEKPGGSGMLEAALVGRGNGEFIATTHCGGGGGGKADDMIKVARGYSGRAGLNKKRDG